MLNYAHQIIKIKQVFQTPETPNFYFISETSKPLSVAVEVLKKIYRVENFRANVPNPDKTNAPIFSDLKFQEWP